MKVLFKSMLVSVVIASLVSLSTPLFARGAPRGAPSLQKQVQGVSQLDKTAKMVVISVMIAGTAAPLAGAKVNVMDMNGDIVVKGRAADADGAVAIEMADGAYVVNVGKSGFKQTQKDVEKIGYTNVSVYLLAEDINAPKGFDVLGSSTIFSRDMCVASQKGPASSELCGVTIPVTFRVRDNSALDVSNATIVFVKDVDRIKYAFTGVTDLDGFASLDMPDAAPPIEFLIFAEGYQPVRYMMDKRLDVSSPPINVFLLPVSGS